MGFGKLKLSFIFYEKGIAMYTEGSLQQGVQGTA